MRAPTLAFVTVAVVVGQEMGQEAQAKTLPEDWQPAMTTDQDSITVSPESIAIATPPETQVEPQFATGRSLPIYPLSQEQHGTAGGEMNREIAINPLDSHDARADTTGNLSVNLPPHGSENSSPDSLATSTAIAPQFPAVVVTSTVAQVSRELTTAQIERFRDETPGVNRRSVRTSQLTTIQVTNRARTQIEIELVGRTRPLVLLPGQTRRLRIDPQDLSLLYWVPGGAQRELTATISQPSLNTIVVNIFPSRFPNGNLAIYMPEPDSRANILRAF